MPRPKNPKEIKQFLGLCSYYRKFIPRFSDIARPLSKLRAHDAIFVWCEQCELSFQMLKDTLVSTPILNILTLLNHILYLQMLVSMDGLEC